MIKILKKITTGFATVRHVRGFRHAVKVAVGPELSDLGLWPIDPEDREVLYHERQIVGRGWQSQQKQDLLDPEKDEEIIPKIIRPYAARYIPLSGRVLDVGCGPVSRLSGGHRRGRYMLTAADLLADRYLDLLRLYGHQSSIEGIQYVCCRGEQLASFLPRDHFDFVTMHNALDHTASPQAVVRQLTAVTKPGGVLVISGRSREATHEHWSGMHQHDLWLENRKVWRAGKNGGDLQDLTAGLPLGFIEGTEPHDAHGEMAAVYRRTADR